MGDDPFGAPPGGADPFGADPFAAPPGAADDLLAPPPGADILMPPADDDFLAPPPQDPMAPAARPQPSQGDEKYKVVRGDSLWRISGKSRIYGDHFRWPLLYIYNKGLIQDPDLIQPGWGLTVKRKLPASEIASAVKKAQDTPRYEPHTAPRRELPIAY
jgi:hypothetical protein